MVNLNKYIKILNNLPEKINEAEVNSQSKKSLKIKYSDNEIKDSSYSDLTELFIRASGEKTGYAYTQDIDEDPKEVLIRAYENSLLIDKSTKDTLNKKYQNKLKNTLENIDTKKELEKAKIILSKIEDELYKSNNLIIGVISEYSVDLKETRVINSSSFDIKTENKIYFLKISVAAEHEGKKYNSSYVSNYKKIQDIDIDEIKNKINENLIDKINPKELEPGIYPTLLDSTVGVNILMTAWQIFSGLKYNEGSSVLSNRINEVIGSEKLNISDVNEHQFSGYKYSFDCEGTTAQNTKLVENGKFIGLMNNIQSSEKNETKPTGNAGRYALLSGTIPTDIIITPKIFYIEEGKIEKKELIEMLENGVYISESYDVFHSINIASGDFSIPCRGVVIKDGKKSKNVTDITISGNLIDLFKNIVQVGNDIHMENFLMKSYCIGSPSILIDKIRIN